MAPTAREPRPSRPRFGDVNFFHVAEHALGHLVHASEDQLRETLPTGPDQELDLSLCILTTINENPDALLPNHPHIRLMYDIFNMLFCQTENGIFPYAQGVRRFKPYNGHVKPRDFLRDLQYYHDLPREELAEELREDLVRRPTRIFTLAQLLVLKHLLERDAYKEHKRIIRALKRRAPVYEILFSFA